MSSKKSILQGVSKGAFLFETRTSSSISSITTSTYLSPVPLSSTGTTPLANAITTTPRQAREPLTAEQVATDYCCHGKFPLLHVIVISLIFGLVLLVVGLVQLVPNADSEAKKYLFLGSAASCLGVGFFCMAVRCLRRHIYRKRMTAPRRMLPSSRDESTFSFCIMEDQDRASPSVDSMTLLQQRF